MERSLIQLKSDFADMADKHKQINSFFWGNFVDAINQDAVDYPLMCCTLQPSQIGDSYTGVDLQVIICDKYNEQDYRMIDEVHSDMLRILKDIDVTLKQFRFQDYLDLETDYSTDPFINEGQDITAGWGGIMRMRVHDYENRCAIPYDGFDFDGSTTGTGCPNATVNVNKSDSTLIQAVTVASGGVENFNVADSTITVNSDTFASVKATDSLNVPVVDSNGDAVATTVDGINVVVDDLPAPKDLTLLLPYSESDTSTEVKIITGSNGTIDTADTTGLTSVVYEVEGMVVTLPFTLAVADELVISFDSAGADGTIKLEGNYV